jgi:hypothetical protein
LCFFWFRVTIRPQYNNRSKPQLKKRVRTMKVLASAVLALTFLMLTVPAQAHHSFNTFWYMDRSLEIEGVVKSFKLVSPHSEMMVEVTEPDGTTVLWRITAKTGAINAKKQGWKPEDFIGKKVKIAGNPPRRDGAKSMAAGVVTFPDGKVVCLGGCPGVPVE